MGDSLKTRAAKALVGTAASAAARVLTASHPPAGGATPVEGLRVNVHLTGFEKPALPASHERLLRGEPPLAQQVGMTARRVFDAVTTLAQDVHSGRSNAELLSDLAALVKEDDALFREGWDREPGHAAMLQRQIRALRKELAHRGIDSTQQ